MSSHISRVRASFLLLFSCLFWNLEAPAEQKKDDATTKEKTFVMGGKCPLRCADHGLGPKVCKEVKQGERCFIEVRAARPGDFEDSGSKNAQDQYGAGLAECRAADARSLAKPYINLRQEKEKNVLGEGMRVSGTVEGVCLVEAGYFENQKKIKDFPVRTTRDFSRFDFETAVNVDARPEIRVYNVNGVREVLTLGLTESQKGEQAKPGSGRPGLESDGRLSDEMFFGR